MALSLLSLIALTGGCSDKDQPPAVQAIEVVKAFPHDSQAFTQGLYMDGGTLMESTGEEGTSTLRKVELETGQVTAQTPLDSTYFGEGAVGWKDRIYQLTWRGQKAFIYNRADLSPRGEVGYSGQGWGLTHNSDALIMSDGTAVLRFLDPESFRYARHCRSRQMAVPSVS